MIRLILLRHGRTGHSGRYIGASDVLLSSEGKRQILELAPDLQNVSIDTIIASPMLRCRQTLDLLRLNVPVQFDSDLREIDFGRWEGQTITEITANDPEQVRAWAAGGTDFCFPEGESNADFFARMERVKARLFTLQSRTALIVTHGGVIRSLICGLLGLPHDRHLLFQVAKGHYSIIDLYSEGGVLTGFNLGGGNDRLS